jgi:HD-GYP domain-containing protein (c-di-GMP phosphodiesterase class II)
MAATIDELALKLRDRDKQANSVKRYPIPGLENQQKLREYSEEEIKESLIENEERAKKHALTMKDNIFHNPFLYGDSIAEKAKLMADVKYRMLNREEEIDLVLYSAKYHDYGKIMIDPNIFLKDGDINRQEFAEIQKHSEYGAELINHCHYPKSLIGHHHEWWNGHGYPDKLKGEDIPLGSRIILIADAYDAMTHDRKYQKAFSQEQALETIKQYSEISFDPELVEIFISEIIKTSGKESNKKSNKEKDKEKLTQ